MPNRSQTKNRFEITCAYSHFSTYMTYNDLHHYYTAKNQQNK